MLINDNYLIVTSYNTIVHLVSKRDYNKYYSHIKNIRDFTKLIFYKDFGFPVNVPKITFGLSGSIMNNWIIILSDNYLWNANYQIKKFGC